MDAFMLIILYITGNELGEYELQEPQPISLHQTRTGCYEAMGTYIFDNAESIESKPFLLRCVDRTERWRKTTD
jgi:hypothetical protein